MKIKKEDLDALTQNSASMATMGIALLLATKCPVVQLYEVAEEHLNQLDEIRISLGLAPASDDLMKSGKLSKAIKKILARAEMKEMKEKPKIGFQPSSGDVDVVDEKKTDGEATDSDIEVEGADSGDDFSDVLETAKELGVDALKLEFLSKKMKIDKSKLN